MADIATSVVASGAEAQLTAFTSMFDLYVAIRPLPAPPFDVLSVRYMQGAVTIEHISVTGNDDRLHRSGDEAVRLFWRFLIEKWGIHPSPTGAPPDPRASAPELEK